MQLERYELAATELLRSFEFVSTGPKGDIRKIIQFTPIDGTDFYNLAFGDKDPVTSGFSDKAITGNGDTSKVLATVVAAVIRFCTDNRNAWIFATGSTQSRTRLYRMGINRYFDLAVENFEIYGDFQGDWIPYQKDTNYQAFILRRKSSKLEL